jgi:hypothetical protein
MANTITSTTTWYVFSTGAEINGGGFDPSIASAGTNWANQATPHVAIDGVTIVGTVAGAGADVVITGYTVATTDIGNYVRIASGTNCVAGYYCITAVNTGTGTWTLGTHSSADPFTGASSDMVAKMGGAWADWRNISSGGSGLPTPIIARPDVGGNIIYMDGGGLSEPTYAQAAYDFSGGTWTITSPGGTGTSIQIIGINGRPGIKFGSAIWSWSTNIDVHIKYMRAFLTANTLIPFSYFSATDFHCDTRGYTTTNRVFFLQALNNCRVTNSGTVGTGSGPAYDGCNCFSCLAENYNGVGFNGGILVDCTAENCYTAGASATLTYITANQVTMNRMTLNNNRGDGLLITCSYTNPEPNLTLINCSITGNSGYGINGDANTLASDKKFTRIYNNNVYGNGTGNYHNFTAKPNDVSIVPGYFDTSNFDWNPSAALRALGIGAFDMTKSYDDETTRNVGTTANKIAVGTSIKIANVTTNGTRIARDSRPIFKT